MGVLRVEGCQKGGSFQVYYKGLIRDLQGCYKSVTIGVSMELQRYYKIVTCVSQGCFMGVSRLLHVCVYGATCVFKGVKEVLHISIMLQRCY